MQGDTQLLIARLRQSINELKRDKENMVRQVCQSRKILSNMQRMKEMAIEDNEKLYSEFKSTMTDTTQRDKQSMNVS